MFIRYLISVFSKEVNSGNQCMVYVGDQAISESLMQSLAAHSGLSETVFLVPDGAATRLRIFSPKREMLSCLHATIAAAYALELVGKQSNINLNGIQIRSDINDHRVLLKVTPSQSSELGNAIDLRLKDNFCAARSIWAVSTASGKLRLMVEFADEQAVTKVSGRSFKELAQRFADIESFFIYAKSSGNGDYYGRMFAPSLGITEDPVNGNSCIALFCILKTQNSGLNALRVRQSRGCLVQLVAIDEEMFVAADCVLVEKSEVAQLDLPPNS